jgi:hypothetical protein
MSHITKLTVIKTTNAIWVYNPSDDDNPVLGGGLDMITTIRTLSIKVCSIHLALFSVNSMDLIDPSFRSVNSEI